MSVYYNENDPKAAATLRELIREGLIAPGDVDDRSIEDVRPDELSPYTQCHFFAGFGIWSYAARKAGWPDNRPLWTGSCPCQPFSAAGKGKGFADERHLWPAFFHLIQHGKPADVPLFGEQVASKDGLSWIDLVQADLEAAGHSVWALDLCAAGFGAPIIRQRFFWAASPDNPERWAEMARWHERDRGEAGWDEGDRELGAGCVAFRMGGTIVAGLAQRIGNGGIPGDPDGACKGEASKRTGIHAGGVDDAAGPRRHGEERHTEAAPWDEAWVCLPDTGREAGGVDGPNGGGREIEGIRLRQTRQDETTIESCGGSEGSRRTGPINGFWRASDWLLCRDDKWRPVEPGTFPLAHGYPERVGILRGAGNAINAEVATAFIEAYLEVENGLQ